MESAMARRFSGFIETERQLPVISLWIAVD